MSKQILNYPFSAVVGQLPLKLALTLAAINPLLGGVLVSGPRGSAKSTLSKSLADVLSSSVDAERPFVHLPLGTSEEMLVGTLDLERVLQDQQTQFRPGILAKADGGVLYVDEVNLLPDNLVDQLLDVAASGINTVERDGISHSHSARFILLGTMNPDEGELRPQLVDRFGLAVTLDKQFSINERVEVVRRREEFDRDPESFCQRYAVAQQQLQQSIEMARRNLAQLACSDDIRLLIAERCCAAEVDGLRADIVWLQAAKAHAAWQQQTQVRQADVLAVEALVLNHRHLSSEPLPPLGSEGSDSDDGGEGNDHSDTDDTSSSSPEQKTSTKPSRTASQIGSTNPFRRPPESRRSSDREFNDYQSGDSPIPADDTSDGTHSHDGDGQDVNPQQQVESLDSDWGAMPVQSMLQSPLEGAIQTSSVPTLDLTRPLGTSRTAISQLQGRQDTLQRNSSGGLMNLTNQVNWFASLVASMGRLPLRRLILGYQRQRYTPVHMVMLDTSASVLHEQALASAQRLLENVSRQAYLQRHRLLIIGFGNQQTNILLPLQRAPKALSKQMPIFTAGGGTPLQAVVDDMAGHQQRLLRRQPGVTFYNYMITDGRIRQLPKGLAGKLTGQTVVIDIETGPIKRGRSRQLADAFGGQYIAIPSV